MVSIDRLLTLGLIGGAAYAFIRLGGAAGIGQRIGGGLESLFTGISTGITKGITEEITPKIPTLDFEQKEKNQTEQEKPFIPDVPIAKEFVGAVERGTISRDFAAKYSFQPPVAKGVLDVSKTFRYLGKPQSSLNLARRQKSTDQRGVGYGGFGSALAQQSALERAIQESATKYPEYFG